MSTSHFSEEFLATTVHCPTGCERMKSASNERPRTSIWCDYHRTSAQDNMSCRTQTAASHWNSTSSLSTQSDINVSRCMIRPQTLTVSRWPHHPQILQSVAMHAIYLIIWLITVRAERREHPSIFTMYISSIGLTPQQQTMSGSELRE
jgi:hypothetical protein